MPEELVPSLGDAADEDTLMDLDALEQSMVAPLPPSLTASQGSSMKYATDIAPPGATVGGEPRTSGGKEQKREEQIRSNRAVRTASNHLLRHHGSVDKEDAFKDPPQQKPRRSSLTLFGGDHNKSLGEAITYWYDWVCLCATIAVALMIIEVELCTRAILAAPDGIISNSPAMVSLKVAIGVAVLAQLMCYTKYQILHTQLRKTEQARGLIVLRQNSCFCRTFQQVDFLDAVCSTNDFICSESSCWTPGRPSAPREALGAERAVPA